MLRATSLLMVTVLSGTVAGCSGKSSPGAAGAGGASADDAARAGGTTGTGGAGGSTTSGLDASRADAPGYGGTATTGGSRGTGGRISMDAAFTDGPSPDIGRTGGRTTGGASGTAGSATGGLLSGGAGGGSGGRTAAGTGGTAGGSTTPGTGGRTSTGGAAGSSTAPGTGGQAAGGTGGTGTGGTGGTGTGGTGGTGTGGPKLLWTDSIQTKSEPWGLDGYGTEHPIGTSVTPSDANGANFSVVPDPVGGSGFAIRHFATFDTGGSRSQGGIYGDVNTIFGKQAKAPEGVWVAQEWYFPEAIGANGDAYCWINLWDFHSIDADRGNRWHTSPGLMLAQDGSMKISLEWGGPAASINQGGGRSAMAMPVGRWFDVEMHYVWSDKPTGTLTLWIDGQLAIEQSGVQTRASSHQVVETYLKFYGSTQGRGPWSPTPSLKYTRNVRVAGERIWR